MPLLLRSRRRLALLGLLVAAAGLLGCSEDEAQTPAACLQGSGPYLEALRSAPAEVRLDGDTAISDCLVTDQQAADLSSAGSAMVSAATRLNAQARRDPGGVGTVSLGYLVGAVQQGADETAGIHADLVRRLDAAARFSPGRLMPASFERAFGRGYAAGQEGG